MTLKRFVYQNQLMQQGHSYDVVVEKHHHVLLKINIVYFKNRNQIKKPYNFHPVSSVTSS
jgi:hypothetical protein